MDMTGVDFGRYKRIVQGFFDFEPRNDDVSGSALWCLGSEYLSRPLQDIHEISVGEERSHDEAHIDASQRDRPEEGREPQRVSLNGLADGMIYFRPDDSGMNRGWPADFLNDCEARIWLTYRSNFPPIMKFPNASMTLSVRLRSLADRQGFTSDTGWGCMIRSGQCLLANALSTVRMGREWRRGLQQEEEKRLLSLFADDPNAPFSIHRFVEHGARACGKHPGEWFGPSATAKCIQALSEYYNETGLKVYVNGDGADVYQDSFLRLAKSGKQSFTPTLILLGVRLGIDRVTPAYWEALKMTLELHQSIGIAGGRPSSSHYFFAHQKDQFFYLDPHFTRPALPLRSDPEDYTVEEVDSCHTRVLRRLSIQDMDPSMLLAFLIKDEHDWSMWRDNIRSSLFKAVVHVADFEPFPHGHGNERHGALDEVEILDDDDEDNREDYDGEIIEHLPGG